MALRSLQPAYRLLLRVALAGMNIGIDGGPGRSGERSALRALFGNHAQPVLVLDVGAHLGNYTREILRETHGAATVHCFEPSRTSYATLAARFAGNLRVTTHHFGLGIRDAEVGLYADAPGSPLGPSFPGTSNMLV